MPSILVVEQEPRYVERISSALRAEGWSVRIVPEADQALLWAASEAPDLVLVNVDTPGVETLWGSFSRSAGGPGILGLLPAGAGTARPAGADDILAKPFSDQDLVLAARRALISRRQAAAAPAVPVQEHKLTSADIFGDVLAEVEGDGTGPSGPAPAPPPRPAAPAPPRASAPPSAQDDEMNRKLEQTLSGMLGVEPRPRPAAPAPAPPRRAETTTGADVDALLSKTLSNLGELGKNKTGVTRPASPAPLPTMPVPVSPPVPVPPPQEATGVRKTRTGAFDFSELEELARPSRRPEPPAPAPPPRPVPVPPIAAAAPPRPVAVPPPAAIPVPVPVQEPPAPAAPPPFLSAPPVSVAPPPPAAKPAQDFAATQRIPVVLDEGDQPGERFGQYTLLEKVAVGGMAEVWKARMRGVEGFQKTVAIKKILPHMTDNSEFVGMFIDEAKLAAQLSHPNIVHIYDLGKIGRDFYIAMEYVDGKDLRSLLNAARRKGMKLPLGLSLLIAARLASALDYAHRKRDFEEREMGIVHRDVSPQNVLLTYEGDVKLCDFGIAKAVSKAAGGQTQIGALKGKLQYMSPEQAWGRPVDSRSDLFSLGAVLFEMVTGERQFPGDTEISVLELVRQGRTRTPRQVDPAIPREVDEIVARALAVDPQQRFASAGEMKQKIESVLAALTPSPSPTDLSAFIDRALSAEPAGVEEPAPLPAPVPFPVPAPVEAAPEPRPVSASEAPVEAVAPLGEVVVEEGGRKSRGLLYAAIAALIVVAILTFFFLNRRKGGEASPAEGTPPPAQGTGPAAAPAALPQNAQAQPGGAPAAGAAPVDMGNLQGLMDEKLAQQEAELKKKLDAEEARLKKQIELAKKNANKAPPEQAPVPAPATAAPPEPARQAVSETAPPPAPTPAPVQPEPEPEPPPRPPAQEQRPAAPEPAPEPAAPRVQVGEMAEAGPGVVAPQLVSFPKPEYPPVARTLRVEGVVTVSVLVDENGRVQDVRMAEPIKQKVGLNEVALASARNARYRPATKEGVRVKMWTRLRIPFKL